jgi:DNA-binding CsgD family transcriptional regulator
VFIEGEAGVGKTSLVRSFAAKDRSRRVLFGTCDPLETPRPLGPLLDMASELGADFAQRIASSASATELFGAVAHRLATQPTRPTVLVFEDIHWADQASLDLLRFLGRRIDGLQALLIATVRDQPAGPVTTLLGDLATTPGVERVRLEPLSLSATAELAAAAALDAADLYRRTGGNPFFVAQVLATGGADLPPTVRDAVLARLARLTPDVRTSLEAAAALGTRLQPDMLFGVLDALNIPRWTADSAIGAGFVDRSGEQLVFRHEIARMAIAEATEAQRRQHLHATILDVMRSVATHTADPATLVEHAALAGNNAAVLELAPQAGNRAAALFAHREAAAFYGRALAAAHGAGLEVRADLLERRARQAFLAGQLGHASADYRAASQLWQRVGAEVARGRCLAHLSSLLFFTGHHAEADVVGVDAVECLEQADAVNELVLAYGVRSQLALLSFDGLTARIWADKAVSLAEQRGDVHDRVDAAIRRGAARILTGVDENGSELRQAQRRARAEGFEELDIRATMYLAFLPALNRRYDDADRLLDEGEEFARDHDLGYWEQLILAVRLMCDLGVGRWRGLDAAARKLLGYPDLAPVPLLTALLTLGRLKARRGEPESVTYLDRALEVGKQYPRLATVTPVWPAIIEAAWLSGDRKAAFEIARDVETEGISAWGPWAVGDLAIWKYLALGTREVGPAIPRHYAAILDGQAEAAARLWNERICPYEAAIALSTSQHPDAVLRAIRALDELGAVPAAAYARHRLRELGATSVPRGPTIATSTNPAHFTRRELDVLRLVASGMSNADVAGRLFLSQKTVERHLSSIFAKLHVGKRADAVHEARRRGALPDLGAG